MHAETRTTDLKGMGYWNKERLDPVDITILGKGKLQKLIDLDTTKLETGGKREILLTDHMPS